MTYTPPDVTILVPMLGRPHHVAPLLESIDATSPGAGVLFLCTPGDSAVEACRASGRDTLVVAHRGPGNYAVKINVGYRETTTPLLFLGASDLRFHPCWFEAAVALLGPGVGVVGTNDLGNPRVIAGEHATHSLVTRGYVDRYGTIDGPGRVLCELYPHDFVDDEFVGTARSRGMYRHAHDSLVEHLHPNWTDDQGQPKAPMDASYAQQGARLRAGRRIFRARRAMWGGGVL